MTNIPTWIEAEDFSFANGMNEEKARAEYEKIACIFPGSRRIFIGRSVVKVYTPKAVAFTNEGIERMTELGFVFMDALPELEDKQPVLQLTFLRREIQ